MMHQALRRAGLWAAAGWLLFACGSSGNGGTDGALAGSSGEGGVDAGMHSTSGTGASAGKGGASGSGGEPATGMKDAAPDDGAVDASCPDGGCSDRDACADGSCEPVATCADPEADCGEASCMDGTDGYACVCDRHATFSEGECVCDLTGTFAVRSHALVSWEDALFGFDVVIEEGSAETIGYGLITITRDGSTLRSESKSCGTQTPDLCSPFFDEAYGQSFPEAIWDNETIPTQTGTLAVDDEAPDGTLSSEPSVAFLGFRFADGVDPFGEFPSSAMDPSLVWMDDDDDGDPGVTSVVTEPGGDSPSCEQQYAYVPVDPSLERAKSIQIGARTISHLQGTIEDCNTLTGQLITDSADGRVYGCTLANDSPCSPDQADFLDAQAKGQSIGETTFVMVRLTTADPTCADARSAPFPSL